MEKNYNRIASGCWGNGMAKTFILVLTVLLLSGCIKEQTPNDSTGVSSGQGAGEQSPPGSDQQKRTESIINIDGSSTVYPISQAMAVEFEKKSSQKVSVGRSGTGSGYKKFALRQIDLWNASRPVAEKEAAECKEKGIEWLELTIAMDGLSIAINPANDWCKEITVAQLSKLWEPESKVQKWSDLNSDWPDQKIDLFGADTDSGTFEYFTEVIVGKKGASRTDYNYNADDNILVNGIATNKYSLGYIPFGYCVENSDRVKVIGVSPTKDTDQTPAPAVVPTLETILSGEYSPLSRPLFVYVNRETLQRSEIQEYLKFVVSSESQPLINKRGFVKVKEELRQQMESRLTEAIALSVQSEKK